jgi:hypothetical protein
MMMKTADDALLQSTDAAMHQSLLDLESLCGLSDTSAMSSGGLIGFLCRSA